MSKYRYENNYSLHAAFLIIVSYMDNRTLYCASENLYTSLQETTVFCIITGMSIHRKTLNFTMTYYHSLWHCNHICTRWSMSVIKDLHGILLIQHAGVVFYYALLQLAIFWLSHVLALFWFLKFPFHARRYKAMHQMKYIHLTCVVIGVLVPFLPIIATMSQFAHGKSAAEAARGGLGFGITRFPSLLCSGRDEKTTFYALVVPIIVIIMIGMTFLILAFRIILKVSYYS